MFHLRRLHFYAFFLVLALNSWAVMAQTPARSPIQVAAQQLLSLNSYIQGERELSYIINDQSILDALNSDLTAVVDQKSMSAGLPLGKHVSEWSLALDQTKLAHSDLWALTTGERHNSFAVPRVSVKYGAGENTNLGLSYMRFAGVGVEYWGVGINQRLTSIFARGDLVARANYGDVRGHPEVGFKSYGFDLIASIPWKGIRPYVGLGLVEGRAKVNLRDLTDLTQSRQRLMKSFLGAEASINAVKFGFEFGLQESRFYQGAKLSYIY